MRTISMAGIALLVLGVLGLAYGSFSYTKETHETKIGPLELSVQDKETFSIPVWVGMAAIAGGGALLVLGSRRT